MWQGCQPPLPLGDSPDIHFCWRMSQPQYHNVAEKSMKNPSDPTGNQNQDLMACSAVPQATAPLCTLL